jgi:polar amino acid transport system substrate-binding protein
MTRAVNIQTILAGCALAFVLGAAEAAAQTVPAIPEPAETPISCGKLHAVERGESLHSIAQRAYGWGKYPAIYLANRDVLPDMSSIFVGMRLLIPCLDGTGPRNRAQAREAGLFGDTPAESRARIAIPAPVPPAEAEPAPAAPELAAAATEVAPEPAPVVATGPVATAAAVVADHPGIGILSGPDFAPFADPSLPEGGMIAELVTLALAKAAPDRPARLSFVDDWSRHLSLLGSGEFNVGLPWYKPDCSRADRLTGSMRDRCKGFVFSDPLFEVAMGFYVRSGDPLETARVPEQLHDKKLCRPAGYFTFDLEQDGLFEPNLTRIIPPTAEDCFIWLERGEVDVVSINAQTAETEIARLGQDGRVAEITALASSQTLHVVAAANSAEGRADIALIDKGMAELKFSGRWFEVVSRHLGTYGLSVR